MPSHRYEPDHAASSTVRAPVERVSLARRRTSDAISALFLIIVVSACWALWHSAQAAPSIAHAGPGVAGQAGAGPAQTVYMARTDIALTDADAQQAATVLSLPQRGYVYDAIELRRRADGSTYRAVLRITGGGTVSLGFARLSASGRESVIGRGKTLRFRATRGTRFTLQARVQGFTLQSRAWPASMPVPAWQNAVTDATRQIPGAGRVGLWLTDSADDVTKRISVTGFSVTSLDASSGARRAASPASSRPATTQPAGPRSTAPQSPIATSVPVLTDAGQPGPSNTGVPAGTRLKLHVGDLTITAPGTVISGLDIHGSVTVDAPNVTLKDSIVRGGPTLPTHGHCIVEDDKAGNGRNFLIEDTELAPTNVNYYQNDICGGNFTALRINSHSGVDTMDIAGNNVTVKDSWLHDTTHFAYSPEHTNGTHNDGIEITVGQNINITHNLIRGGSNAAIQITQDQGVTTNLTMAENWLDGGTCSLHIDDEPLSAMTDLAVLGNVFTRGSNPDDCAAVVTHGVSMTWTGNTWTGGEAAIPIVYG